MRNLEITSLTNHRPFKDKPLIAPFLFGTLGGLGLLAFYLGVIALSQGWPHAFQQLGDDRWFILPITAGFALQVSLFVYLHQLHARTHALPVAASATTSSVAMLACCAHHLADIFPIIGLSGAALFLNDFKIPFLIAGIVMNLGGIGYLLFKIIKAKSSTAGTIHSNHLKV